MLILSLQIVGSLTLAWFAILALRVARLPAAAFARSTHHDAWWVVAVAFAVLAGHLLLQEAAAVWAFVQGPGSAAWEGYVRWMGVGNNGRLMVVVAMALALLATAVDGVPRGRAGRALTVGAYALALALGSWLGWREARVDGGGVAHFSDFAVISVVEVAVMLGALLVGLLRGILPRFLWGCLALYTLQLILNVGTFSALAWSAVMGEWRLPAHLVVVYPIVLHLLMGGLTLRQLAGARRGRPEGELMAPARGGGELLGRL